jgi:hypothetical protein
MKTILTSINVNTLFGSRPLWIIPLLFTAISVPNVHADIITNYTIDFTLRNGSPDATGSFAYDYSTSLFTNFTVMWDTFTFDLTSVANNPFIDTGDGPLPTCLTATAGASASLSLLLDCGGGGPGSWGSGLKVTGLPIGFSFSGFGQPGPPLFIPGSIQFSTDVPTSDCPCSVTDGSYTVAPQSSTALEPGTIMLTLTGIALAWAIRKRMCVAMQ